MRECEATSAPGAPLLDRAAVLGRVSEDWELLRELAGIFLEECPRCLTEIRASIRHSDARELKVYAHRLAGTASHFGAQAVSAAARRLELMGSAGQLAGAAEA